MAYATKDDLKQALDPAIVDDLARDTGDDTAAAEATMTEILAQTQGMVAGYLARYGSAELSATAAIAAIKPRLLDMAVYRLLSRRLPTRVSETVRDANKAAERYFETVAKGDIDLPGVSETPVASVELDEGIAGSDTAVFNTAGGWGSF